MEEKRPKKLLNQVRDAIRLKHYSIRTACPAEGAEGSKPTLAGSHATSPAQTGLEPETCGS